MTEQEKKAIKLIENIRDDAIVTLDYIEREEQNVSPLLYSGRKEKAETILKGFKELEQYRTLGSVQFIKDELSSYDYLIQSQRLNAESDIKELNEFRTLGTVEELREAREKQVAKKVIIVPSREKEITDGIYVFYECPECGHKIASGFYYPPYNEVLKTHQFCASCGQAIDWSDTDEQ